MTTHRFVLAAASFVAFAFFGCAAPVESSAPEPNEAAEATGTAASAQTYDQCYQACASKMCDDWGSGDPALPSCTLNADFNCSSQCSGKLPKGGGSGSGPVYRKKL